MVLQGVFVHPPIRQHPVGVLALVHGQDAEAGSPVSAGWGNRRRAKSFAAARRSREGCSPSYEMP